MDNNSTVEVLKAFRKWLSGSGKKYVSSLPNGMTREILSEAVRKSIEAIRLRLSVDDFAILTAAAGAHCNRFSKNRKGIAATMSAEESAEFEKYIVDLKASVKKAGRIIRAVNKAEGR